jgi:hypothetical protein
MVIINTPKCREKVNRNEDIEENTEIEETPKLQTTSFIRLYQVVILFMICLLLWITRINLINNQKKAIIHQPLFTESVVCNRTKTINELIRIEKKIVFYDIRQHNYNIGVTKNHLFGDGNGNLKSRELDEDRRVILLEYLSRLNNIDSSIFEKYADEILIFTHYHGVNIYDVRMRNNGYIIDNKFIENIVSHTRCLSPIEKSQEHKINKYEVELMEFANELHNVFYNKLRSEYQKIEYKYMSIPSDFTEFDKLMNDTQYNEIEIISLDEYDLKRRKLEIRELKLLFDLKPAPYITY